MSNLTKLDFEALDISGKNYLAWSLDAEIHLNAEGHGDAIKEGNKTSDQQKAKTMIFLCHHLHQDLKNEYLIVKDPQVLWNSLKERFDHQKMSFFLKLVTNGCICVCRILNLLLNITWLYLKLLLY